MLQGLTRL